MQRHPFDPVSAALGILAVTFGVLVVVGEAAEFDTGGGWWIGVAAVLIGLAIIPWRGRSGDEAGAPAAETHTVDMVDALDAEPDRSAGT